MKTDKQPVAIAYLCNEDRADAARIAVDIISGRVERSGQGSVLPKVAALLAKAALED